MADIIIVPVSGGKDSQVVLSLAKSAGHKLVCVHQDTGYDHPATYQHLIDMEEFYGVKIERTHNKHGGMFGFLEHARYFPNSAARGCTQRLKQEPFAEWITEKGYTAENSEIWFGMRSGESANRADKYGTLTHDDVFTLGDISKFYVESKRRIIGQIPCRMPIVDWDTDKVFSHLMAEGAPINPLYSKGHHRVGCYPCLLARKAEWQLAAKDPVGVEHLKKLIDLEDKWVSTGNPRKYIKVHRAWNVRDFLTGTTADLFDTNDQECGYCSI